MTDDLLKTVFLKKEEIAHQTWRFDFEKSFTFKAGQYTTIFLGNDNRDFTICSSPHDRSIFSIVTKEGISDFKKNLFSLLPGSKITLKNPAGGFTLRQNPNQKVFLAGGIGMTPFYSMIQDVYKNQLSLPITLIVSFAKKEDMCFYKELQIIAKHNKNIHVIYSLTKEAWKGNIGRISQDLIAKYIPDIKKAEYMVAGGEKMVEDTEKILLDMGISSENIRIDIFTGY